jgi:hypothetical protein
MVQNMKVVRGHYRNEGKHNGCNNTSTKKNYEIQRRTQNQIMPRRRGQTSAYKPVQYSTGCCVRKMKCSNSTLLDVVSSQYSTVPDVVSET